MRTLQLIITFLFFVKSMAAQHLDVEGDAKILGKIDLDDGNSSVVIGRVAGLSSTGDRNVFLGTYAGRDNSSGIMNTFIGHATGLINVSGEQNVFIGTDAGRNNIYDTPDQLHI